MALESFSDFQAKTAEKPLPSFSSLAMGEVPTETISFDTQTSTPVVAKPGTPDINPIRDVLLAVPRAIITVGEELKKGSFGVDKTEKLPPALSLLYGADQYQNINADISQRLQNGDGVLSSYLGAISGKALDVAFGASVAASGFRSLAAALEKGGTPAQIEAWKTLGSPATEAELKTTYRKLAQQFHPDLTGGDDTAIKAINKANSVLKKQGIPVSGRIAQESARYAEVLGRETPLGKKPLLNFDFGLKPSVNPAPLGAPELPGYRARPGQAQPVGLSLSEQEPVGFNFGENKKPEAAAEIFIRPPTAAEKPGGTARSRGFNSIAAKEGYETVYKPYGAQGVGYYYVQAKPTAAAPNTDIRAALPDEQKTIYYHGTTPEVASKIKTEGFNTEAVSLTPDFGEALDYSNGDTNGVVAVRVKTNAREVNPQSREPLYHPQDIRVAGDGAAEVRKYKSAEEFVQSGNLSNDIPLPRQERDFLTSFYTINPPYESASDFSKRISGGEFNTLVQLNEGLKTEGIVDFGDPSVASAQKHSVALSEAFYRFAKRNEKDLTDFYNQATGKGTEPSTKDTITVPGFGEVPLIGTLDSATGKVTYNALDREVAPQVAEAAAPLATSDTPPVAGSLAEKVAEIKKAVPEVKTANEIPPKKPKIKLSPEKVQELSKDFRASLESDPLTLKAVKKQEIPEDKKLSINEPSVFIAPTEENSLELMAAEHNQSEFVLDSSVREEERLLSNLESIFADLKGVQVEDLKRSFSAQDLEQAQVLYEIALENVMNNPVRAVTVTKEVTGPDGSMRKVKSRRSILNFMSEGEFLDFKNPDLAKSPAERESIIERNRRATRATESAFEGTTLSGMFDNPDVIREQIAKYLEQKAELVRIQQSLRDIRTSIRLQKAKNQFIESSKRLLASKVAKDLKALRSLIEAANRAGFKQGAGIERKKLADMVSRLKSRRTKIRALQAVYGLSDSQMHKIRGTADPRFMDASEFGDYYKGLEDKALVEKRKNEERVIIDAIIQERDLKKTENLQHALELPPLRDMSLDQLFEFDAALSQTAPHDTYLGPRMIQTVINTDLGAVKTIRELRAALSKDATIKTGQGFENLQPLTGGSSLKFLYDSALAARDPRYRYIVTLWTAKNIESEIALFHFKKEVNRLASAARASRTRSLSEQILQKAAPQDRMVVDWLQRLEDRPQFERNMTPAELEFAQFLDKTFRRYWEIAAVEGFEKKTLLGVKFSRFKGVYFPHSPLSFFERWREDGLVRATKGIWNQAIDRRVDFDAIGPTGEILGYEKFLKYALKREGNIESRYSLNAARVAISYVAAFEKKLALDTIIPKIDAMVYSQAREPGVGLKDPTGEGIDGRLRQFIKQWLNNKKGRHTTFLIDQGSKAETTLRALKIFLTLKDIGLNIVVGIGSMGGNLAANFSGLSTKAFAVGAGRSVIPKGIALLKRYPGVVGEPAFENIIQASQDVGDSLTAGAFSLFQELSYRSRGQFFLGSLTKEEYESGVVSLNRQAEIKIDMGRFHPIEKTGSVVGSSTEGSIATQYKKWTLPFIYTAYYNAKRLVAAARSFDRIKTTLSGPERAKRIKDLSELLKITLGGIGLYLFFANVFATNDNDKSFTARLKRNFVRDISSSIGSFSLKTWLVAPRQVQFAYNLFSGIESLVKLERYKTSGADFKAGDLKGAITLKREFTPAAVRQFLPSTAKGGDTSSSASGKIVHVKLDSGKGTGGKITHIKVK